MRVLIQYSRLPHYRLPLLRQLVQYYGWDITYAYTRTKGHGESGLEVDKVDFIHALPVPMTRIGVHGLKIFFQREVIRLLKSCSWDAFIWEGAHANLSGYFAARYAQRQHIPSVCWIKGYFTPLGLVRRVVTSAYLRAAHAFIPYGDTTHEFLKAYGVRPEQIVRAYNTVDIETLVANQELIRQRGREILKSVGWEDRRPLISSVGRLSKIKRVEDAIKAVKLLHQQGVETYLLVVGDGPERPFLEQLTARLGLTNHVRFTGRVPENDDSAALAVSDLTVQCCYLGLVINQAMALRVPVVASSDPGPDGEMVIAGKTGWRFPIGDIQALAGAILEVLTSPRREEVVETAHQFILERWNLAQYAKAFNEAVLVARRECNKSGQV